MSAIDPNVDLALRRYAAMLSYFQYEGNIFWVRSQHFLVAHAALIGFISTKLPVTVECEPWARIYTLGAASLGGLLLALLWHRAISAGEFWIAHWTEILQALEAEALQDHRAVRNFDPPAGHRYVSAKQVARRTATLFTLFWIAALFYLAFSAIVKWRHLELA